MHFHLQAYCMQEQYTTVGPVSGTHDCVTMDSLSQATVMTMVLSTSAEVTV